MTKKGEKLKISWIYYLNIKTYLLAIKQFLVFSKYKIYKNILNLIGGEGKTMLMLRKDHKISKKEENNFKRKTHSVYLKL